MAAGTHYAIVLDHATAKRLARLSRARKTPAGQARRAAVLVARAKHIPVRRICADLRCSSAFVAKVCQRYHRGGWDEARRELPRGRPRRRDPAERAALAEWAQTPPQQLGRPVTRWSLAQFRVHAQRVGPEQAPPARSTVARWLHAEHLLWWRSRSWCTTNDANFELKERLVCDAYLSAPPQYAVLCYDQAPHLQALSRRVARRPARRGKPGRCEHDYRRNGTCDVHVLLDTRTGRCVWATTWRHDQFTIAGLFTRWLAARPETHIILICDNLSANHAPAVKAALARLGKVVLVFRIPTHSSWLNQVERVFADLQRELLDWLEARKVGQLALAIGRWFRDRNERAKPYNWRYHPDSRLCETGH